MSGRNRKNKEIKKNQTKQKLKKKQKERKETDAIRRKHKHFRNWGLGFKIHGGANRDSKIAEMEWRYSFAMAVVREGWRSW